MLSSVFVVFLVAGLNSAQDFGGVYNRSSVIVNFLTESDAKLYDERDVTNLDEQKWYIAGRRVQGDTFKADTSDKYDFPATRDFHLELKFPKQNDFYITHVSCLVEQSSSLGRSYIVDGGVGYNYMTLVFEAKRTQYFYYIIYIFGRTYQ